MYPGNLAAREGGHNQISGGEKEEQGPQSGGPRSVPKLVQAPNLGSGGGARVGVRGGRGLGLPSHGGILMSFLARSDGAGRDGVMKTDDPRPALLIFLLEEGESQRGACEGEGGLPSAWVPSALVPPSSLLPCHPSSLLLS